ncbi:hypothetical protein [Paenibacillus sp. OV219]|nr:hypothetical protein [Paenibacillus sp. OV219]
MTTTMPIKKVCSYGDFYFFIRWPFVDEGDDPAVVCSLSKW